MEINEQISFLTINNKNDRGSLITTRKELLQEIDNLEERDLYLLDKNFNFKTSSINKKDNLLLVKIDYFRCFIIRGIAYIAVSNSNDNDIIIDFQLEDFIEKISSKILDLKNPQKFKWKVLEQIFIDVSESFQKEIENIAPNISLISNDLFTEEEHVITNREFINLNIDLLKMQARAKDVYELFEELTPDDKEEHFDNDDIPQNVNRNTFIDLIDNYKMRFEEAYRDIKNMLEILETATEINATRLDEKRNRMQLISVYLNVITLGIAMGALLTGMFGMNLKNGWEDSYPAFVVVCMVIVVILGISIILVKVVNVKIKIK